MNIRPIVRFAVVPLIFILLAGINTVRGESNITDDYNQLFLFVTVLSVLVAALVIGLWAYFIYRFRENNETERKPLKHADARKLEIAWTLVAVFIVILLMIFSYPILFSLDNDEKNLVPDREIIVEGTGGWTWRFHYDSGYVAEPVTKTENGFAIRTTTMRLEVGLTYKFILWSSGDLIHSFFVPDLNFKSDLVPGTNNTITIKIEKAGTFNILCAEFCGFGHSGMRGIVEAVNPLT